MAARRMDLVCPGTRQLDRLVRARSCIPWKRTYPRIDAQLNAKGRRHMASDIAVKRIMGEGAFGQVFEVRLERGTAAFVGFDRLAD